MPFTVARARLGFGSVDASSPYAGEGDKGPRLATWPNVFLLAGTTAAVSFAAIWAAAFTAWSLAPWMWVTLFAAVPIGIAVAWVAWRRAGFGAERQD